MIINDFTANTVAVPFHGDDLLFLMLKVEHVRRMGQFLITTVGRYCSCNLSGRCTPATGRRI
jgi:hypothetical protein